VARARGEEEEENSFLLSLANFVPFSQERGNNDSLFTRIAKNVWFDDKNGKWLRESYIRK